MDIQVGITYSSWNPPCMCRIFICFTIVDLPDSPAPVERKHTDVIKAVGRTKTSESTHSEVSQPITTYTCYQMHNWRELVGSMCLLVDVLLLPRTHC